MNTEKLEKLKKSLDNKFIPDNMKDKIRAEIKKLEADIKTDETITATEVKEEVKEIEKKVEKALEVAEEKEEKAEAKKEEAEERAEAKAEEKKAKKSRTKTQKVEGKPKSAKKSVFSIAKEIRKDNESWEDAKERARKMMKSETTETKKKTRTETDKLLAMVRRNKEYKKLAGTSNLQKDASRRALPRGKRISKITGDVYYENRANRVDVGGFKNAYLAKGGEIEMENSNLYFVGRGRDVNGNKVIKISFPNQKPFSIQTLGNLPKTHRILREYDNDKDITPEEIATIEREVIAYIEEFGSKKQKESLRKYEGGGYANKGVYVETLDEEIDLTDDGKPRVLKTQEGGNKSFSQRREMHGASPEALAFDNGGKVGRYSILGEVDGEQPVLYATTDDKERIKPLVNMAEIDLYELTGKNHRIFVTDEVTDDEVYSYGNGGRTRERRYVNHSEDYEVRYAKNKPNRTGYLGKRSFDDGGISNGRYEVVKVIGFYKNGKTLPKNEIKVIADFDNRKEALNFVYEQQFKKDVTQRDIFIRDTKTNKTFADGGFMTDPNFGDFQNGVYATGGVTKNYINRNQLNTITIKKGDKKLTYKVSDVYNGAYKLEDGGNLERTAFYVSKRNVVKVQLKDGKDVKVANGYWIKKGAKPIHTSKYDDGGEIRHEDYDDVIDMWDKLSISQRKKLLDSQEDLEEYGNHSEIAEDDWDELDDYVTDVLENNFKSKMYAGGGYLKNGYFKNEIDNDYIEEINKYYNKWNSIKDEKDSENFKKTKPPMFGTYQETDILNQIKHFEKLDIPFQANEVSRNQFKKEVSKIIDNFMNKKSYKGGGSTKRGGAMQLAKQIRKEGESWQSALKRANEQMRKK